MIVDTSALLAFFNGSEARHLHVSATIAEHEEQLVVSPYVIAELDYLLATRIGIHAELAALRELAGGAWELPELTTAELARATDVIERCPDQLIGVADASSVVLAERYHTRTIATLDRRHFDLLRPFSGGHFTVVP